LTVATGRWALAALPIGVVLGFALSRGGLCGAAAIGEVLVLRDRRKLAGFGVAVVATMVSFAVLDALGLVTLNPRQFRWASALVGGTTFGIGMALAGGCVSGTLFKCGEGHLNSLVALPAIAFGIHAVDLGFLSGLDRSLRSCVIEGASGEPLTFASLSGIPYVALVAVFVVIALAIGLRRRDRSVRPGVVVRQDPVPVSRRWLVRSWRPWQAGLVVGLLAVPAWLTSQESGRDLALCVTYGVEEIPLLVGDHALIWTGEDLAANEATPQRPKVWVWLVCLVVGLVAGAHLAARLLGRAGLKRRPPGELVTAAVGGLLVGVGAGLGRGCTLGNGVTGAALMSIGMIAFAVVAAVACFVTTRIYVFGPRR
jgi:uncharacterized protein